MALDSGALPVANPNDNARGDFNAAMTQLDAAFPLAAINLAADAVETVKIKNLNVTTGKLAALVVTAIKLAADAVETAKIKDLNVTVAKLAADAVETAKIKDLNVATGKLAALAVTAAKLATDAVETVKVKDKNITAPKLSDEILMRYLYARPFFYEDFIGAVLNSRWVQFGEAGGSAFLLDGGQVEIKTGAVTNDAYWLSWNSKKPYNLQTQFPKMIVLTGAYTNTDVELGAALWRDANNHCILGVNRAIGANWQAASFSGGVSTIVDTGVVADGTDVKLQIDYIGANEIKFYINDVLKATIVTDVVTGDCEFLAFVITNANAQKHLRLKYIGITCER